MSFEKKLELFEDSLANVSSVSSECRDLIQNRVHRTTTTTTTTTECVFRDAYLLNEAKDINELIEELTGKILNIKNILMADQISPTDVDYKILVDEKITENNKQKRFMEMLAPYMFRYLNN